MTMGDIHSLVFPLLFRPALTQLGKSDPVALSVRSALASAEGTSPGLTLDLALAIIHKSELDVNIEESLLRLQGNNNDEYEASEFRSSRSEEPFRELNKKSVQLKRLLSRIPDEIVDRKTFLESIKEIASTIKKVLDSVTGIAGYLQTPESRTSLERRKREFVKYSKRFSTTLKEYFRDGLASPVYTTSLYLINQTNLIMTTVKELCD